MVLKNYLFESQHYRDRGRESYSVTERRDRETERERKGEGRRDGRKQENISTHWFISKLITVARSMPG